MSLPSFNFLYIKAGEGKTGTTGDQLEVSWTTNFNLIKELINSLDEDVQTRVISKDIKALKVENGIAYFTVDNEKWVSLGPSFANITGDPDQCLALAEKFNKYTTIIQFNSLANRVTEVESDIVILENNMTLTLADINTLKDQMNNSTTGVLVRLAAVETDVSNKITGISVTQIRERATGLLEYTTDGEHWEPVASATGIDWGEIGGNVENQLDLKNWFDSLSDSITEVSESIDTKINAAIAGIEVTPEVRAMTASQYEALEQKDESTVYMITDKSF